MKRMITTKKRVTAAHEAQIVPFAELTDAQKAQAVELAGSDRKLSEIIYSWYDEVIMEDYHHDVQELADDLTSKTGIGVNTDKLYWGSNSQGPYPEWELFDVLDMYDSPEDSDSMLYQIKFAGGGTDVFSDTCVDLFIPDDGESLGWEGGEWYDGISCDEESLREEGADDTTIAEILEKIEAVQEFIDSVWRLINHVCTDFPDDEWIAKAMEVSDFEFLVDGDHVSYAG